MASALPQKSDIAIAHKAINLCEGLSSSARRVAGALIDHFNRRTGRCDPSGERLAALLGMDRTSVIRATNELTGKASKKKSVPALFRKTSHGGHSHCASYEPKWESMREVVREWDRRMKSGALADFVSGENEAQPKSDDQPNVAKLQRSESQNCNVQSRRPATQTYSRNPSKEPIQKAERVANAPPNSRTLRSGQRSKGPGNGSQPDPQRYLMHALPGGRDGPAFKEAASEKAKDRINKGMHALGSEVYIAFVVDLPDADHEKAISAELCRKGGGVPYVLERLRDMGKTAATHAEADRVSSEKIRAVA